MSAVVITGCSGNGQGLDQNGRLPTPGSAGTALAATFNSIQDNIFTPVCTRCHAGATAPLGLRLDAGNSYSLLVGVASSEVPTIQRVKPGDPSSSYLIQKLSGTAAVGQRMPLGGPFLPQASIDVISQWIANGAPRPTSFTPTDKVVQSVSSGLQVLTTSPQNGDLVTSRLNQIVIGFDREVDANLVNASTITLQRIDTHALIAVDLSVPIVNPWTVLATPREPLTNGAYRLSLRGSGGGALAGLDARPLNSQGAFDGGQDTSIEFTVEVQP